MATGASASHQDGHGVLEHFTRFKRMLCVFSAYHFLAVMALRSERTPRLNFEWPLLTPGVVLNLSVKKDGA